MAPTAGPPALPPVDVDSVLAWGQRVRRDAPWRRTRDPWAVLVSELMLQQTQVARVAERFGPFLERFADPASCAAAARAEVLAAWSGLGYYRRAVNLHRAAAAIVDRHGGRVPEGLDDLLALPGVGPYTARAVLAHAFEHDVAAIDTNVGRVLARWVGERLTPARAQRLGDALVPPGRGWAWSQTLMDLGASRCRSRAPVCEGCPARSGCAWGGAGPDPAQGSAGVGGRQAPFAGSDREGRGRLLAALGDGEVPRAGLAEVMGWPDDPERAARVAEAMIADGLVSATAAGYRLGD